MAARSATIPAPCAPFAPREPLFTAHTAAVAPQQAPSTPQRAQFAPRQTPADRLPYQPSAPPPPWYAHPLAIIAGLVPIGVGVAMVWIYGVTRGLLLLRATPMKS